MRLRLYYLFPAFAFMVIALINLIFGGGFHFYLWSFVAMVALLIAFPLAIKMNDKNVPVLHIVSITLLSVIFLAINSFFDLRQTGFNLIEAATFGFLLGLLIVAIIMIIKGK